MNSSQFSLRLTRGNITANKVTFDLYYSTVAYFKLTVGLFLFFCNFTTASDRGLVVVTFSVAALLCFIDFVGGC